MSPLQNPLILRSLSITTDLFVLLSKSAHSRAARPVYAPTMGSMDHNGGAYARARTMVNAASLPILFISCARGGNSEARAREDHLAVAQPHRGIKDLSLQLRRMSRS